jgi:hypothetical protein
MRAQPGYRMQHDSGKTYESPNESEQDHQYGRPEFQAPAKIKGAQKTEAHV